jgi:PIN domain nuclease of toxin-antitoxin system
MPGEAAARQPRGALLFAELAISSEHAITAGRLPLIHRDPFDRMLVAQAQCEDLMLVTRDPYCQKYEVAALPA